MDGSGRVVCAADMAFMSKISPLAVGFMLKASPYQEATPRSSYLGCSRGTYQMPPT